MDLHQVDLGVSTELCRVYVAYLNGAMGVYVVLCRILEGTPLLRTNEPSIGNNAVFAIFQTYKKPAVPEFYPIRQICEHNSVFPAPNSPRTSTTRPWRESTTQHLIEARDVLKAF